MSGAGHILDTIMKLKANRAHLRGKKFFGQDPRDRKRSSNENVEYKTLSKEELEKIRIKKVKKKEQAKKEFIVILSVVLILIFVLVWIFSQ